MTNDAAQFPEPTENQKRNLETARRVLTEVWGEGQLEICDEVFTHDFVRHDANSGDSYGPEGYKELVAKTRTAFPDLRVEIENLVPHQDAVLFRTTMYATHRGKFQGIPPTGANVVVQTLAEVHFNAEGMSTEAWVISDYLGVFQTLLQSMKWWQLLLSLPAIIKQSRTAGSAPKSGKES